MLHIIELLTLCTSVHRNNMMKNSVRHSKVSSTDGVYCLPEINQLELKPSFKFIQVSIPREIININQFHSNFLIIKNC